MNIRSVLPLLCLALPACSLVTVPVKTAGSIVTTTVRTTGDVVTAPFNAVGRSRTATDSTPAPATDSRQAVRTAPTYYPEERRPAQPVTR